MVTTGAAGSLYSRRSLAGASVAATDNGGTMVLTSGELSKLVELITILI
jgi:hypothetical protein